MKLKEETVTALFSSGTNSVPGGKDHENDDDDDDEETVTLSKEVTEWLEEHHMIKKVEEQGVHKFKVIALFNSFFFLFLIIFFPLFPYYSF
jgi:hypothetical protein